jgi:outer membrane protein TolC
MRLEQEKAEASCADLRQQILLEVREAELTLRHAREALRGSAEGVTLAERALAIARARLDQGMATYLEFTDSNVALSRARLTRLGAMCACRQAWIELQYATGGDLSAAAEEGPEDE